MTYLAFSFCDLEWWHGALAWLLPFLLGLLLGYAIWAKYKKMKEELEGDIRGLNKVITGLEADLDTCHHAKTDLDSEVSLLKGQLREKKLQISTLESSLEAASKNKGGKTKAAAIVGGVAAAGLTSSKKSKKGGNAAGGKTNKDDLKKVEGIGPKIEGLLNTDGIWTFSELASSSVSRIQKVLDAAGSRYRIAKPDTWPEQAGLARDGKWDELATFQDNLKGGKKT